MEYIGKKMIVDTPKADGGVYFEKEYFEFRSRDARASSHNFKIMYRDIERIDNYTGIKKTVVITLKDGFRQYFYMYKNNTFIALIKAGMENNKEEDIIDVEAKVEEDVKSEEITEEDLRKLKELNELRKDGALSKEEFDKQKAIILEKYN